MVLVYGHSIVLSSLYPVKMRGGFMRLQDAQTRYPVHGHVQFLVEIQYKLLYTYIYLYCINILYDTTKLFSTNRYSL